VYRMRKQAPRQILAMPLTSLASAEHLLPTDVFVGYGEDTWGTDDSGRKHLVFPWERLVLPLLEDVEVEYPQLPWAHGLRGLYYLCLARWDCRRLATLRSSVTEAEAELRRRDQAERVAQADEPAQEQQVTTDADFHAMLDRMVARAAAAKMDELRAVEPLARWEAEQAAAHLRIATEGDDDPVALVGLVTAEELQRVADSSPGPDESVSEYVDERSNGAALAKALHRFSSTVQGEGMMVAYDAGGFLKLASWVLPDAPEAAESIRHEIDRLSRRLMFAVVKKMDFWFVPRTD
jgi:hypothetical protein